MTVLIFIARAFIAGGFQAAYVYTPEVRDPVRLQLTVQIREPIVVVGISAGVSNGDQGFGSGDKQWNGESGCPDYTICRTGRDVLHVLSLKPCQLQRCAVYLLALSQRWCWNRLCTWLCPCTAAAASSPPSPPAHCPLRRQAGPCRSPASTSGDRKWWAAPRPGVQRGSLIPPRAHRADLSLNLNDGWPQGRKNARTARLASCAHLQSYPKSLCTTVASKEPASTVLCIIAIVICYHRCHHFTTVYLPTAWRPEG